MTQSGKDKQPIDTPPRRNWVAPVARDISSTALSAFARAGFSDPALILRWAEIVGPDVARFAQPFRLTEGKLGATLTLRAEPGAAVFLQHESRALCERINAFLGRPVVAGLRFVQGSVAASPSRTAIQRPPRAVSSGDPALGFAGTQPLREALIRLAKARKSGG